MSNKQFWMIHVEGTEGPLHKHSSEEGAINEGMRLAKSTGRSTFLLEAKLRFNVGDIVTTDLSIEEVSGVAGIIAELPHNFEQRPDGYRNVCKCGRAKENDFVHGRK